MYFGFALLKKKFKSGIIGRLGEKVTPEAYNYTRPKVTRVSDLTDFVFLFQRWAAAWEGLSTWKEGLSCRFYFLFSFSRSSKTGKHFNSASGVDSLVIVLLFMI